jgi:hypothetical protein
MRPPVKHEKALQTMVDCASVHLHFSAGLMAASWYTIFPDAANSCLSNQCSPRCD